MATVSGSVSTMTRNPRHWQLAVLVMATLPSWKSRTSGQIIRSPRRRGRAASWFRRSQAPDDDVVANLTHGVATVWESRITAYCSGGGAAICCDRTFRNRRLDGVRFARRLVPCDPPSSKFQTPGYLKSTTVTLSKTPFISNRYVTKRCYVNNP